MTIVTLLTAHPLKHSFNHSLADAWQRGAEAAGATVRRFEVGDLQFDPILRGAYQSPMPDEPDLAKVRAAFEESSHVTWVFPTWWANLPASMKGLIDRLLLPKWSFRFDDGQLLPEGLLKGRSTRYVSTMDTPSLWYRILQRDALAGSFGRGTLSFVGFKPIERTMLFSVRGMNEAKRAKWLRRLEAEGYADVKRIVGRLPANVEVRGGA
ncbi:MAG: NAD(P)H-dependent oxidoreductase [Archangium sp.]